MRFLGIRRLLACFESIYEKRMGARKRCCFRPLLQVCDHPCGVCGKVAEVVDTTERDKDLELLVKTIQLGFQSTGGSCKKELEDTIEAENCKTCTTHL